MKYKLAKDALADQRRLHLIDKHKYLFELLKHMTTLSSGSVLLLLTFLEKVLRNNSPGIAVKLAFVGFFLSILFSLLTMLALSSSLGKIEEEDRSNFLLCAMIALMGFCGGIAALLVACLSY